MTWHTNHDKAIFTFSLRKFFCPRKSLKHAFYFKCSLSHINNERHKDTKTMELYIKIIELLLYMKQMI